MAQIYKYPIPEPGVAFDLKIKGFQEVVHVGEDGNGVACIWAQVNADLTEEAWPFMLVATGQPFDGNEWCHVGSFVQKSGLVWHLMRPFQSVAAMPRGAGTTVVYIVSATPPSSSLPLVTDPDVGRRFFETYADAQKYIDNAHPDQKDGLHVYSVLTITQQKVTFEVPF